MAEASRLVQSLQEVMTDEGFARRVDAELDALGYPTGHVLRLAARARFNTKEAQ